jgi:hypothetical protein
LTAKRSPLTQGNPTPTKIDNVKAKIQDQEHWGPRSRPTLARPHAPDQLAASPNSWHQLQPVTHKWDPPGESPPRTTSLLLARQVSVSHKLPPTPTGAWAMACGTSTYTVTCGGTIPRAMQTHQLVVMQAAGPYKSLNAGLSGCTAIPSTSSLTLPHASSARGTQEPPMTS